MDWIRRVTRVSSSQGSIVFLCLAVGLIFATQGFLKYTDPTRNNNYTASKKTVLIWKETRKCAFGK
jgi:hypothetical protein